MKYYSRRVDTKVVRDTLQIKVSTYRAGDNEFMSQVIWEVPLNPINGEKPQIVDVKIKEEDFDEQDSDGE